MYVQLNGDAMEGTCEERSTAPYSVQRAGGELAGRLWQTGQQKVATRHASTECH